MVHDQPTLSLRMSELNGVSIQSTLLQAGGRNA
jgi:hypothetical protein